jgi:hypothetical protein
MRIIYSTRNVEIPAGGVYDTAVCFYSVVADCVVMKWIAVPANSLMLFQLDL